MINLCAASRPAGLVRTSLPAPLNRTRQPLRPREYWRFDFSR